jgi:hypothetical protein
MQEGIAGAVIQRKIQLRLIRLTLLEPVYAGNKFLVQKEQDKKMKMLSAGRYPVSCKDDHAIYRNFAGDCSNNRKGMKPFCLVSKITAHSRAEKKNSYEMTTGNFSFWFWLFSFTGCHFGFTEQNNREEVLT